MGSQHEPPRSWERVRPAKRPDRFERETYERHAPSPREQILTEHERELADQSAEEDATEPEPDPEDATTSEKLVFCF